MDFPLVSDPSEEAAGEEVSAVALDDFLMGVGAPIYVDEEPTGDFFQQQQQQQHQQQHEEQQQQLQQPTSFLDSQLQQLQIGSGDAPSAVATFPVPVKLEPGLASEMPALEPSFGSDDFELSEAVVKDEDEGEQPKAAPARRRARVTAGMTPEERARLRAEANKASAAASRQRRKVLVAKLNAEESVLRGRQKDLKRELKQRRFENNILQGELRNMVGMFSANPLLSALLAAQRDAQNGAVDSKMPEDFQRMLQQIALPSHLPRTVEHRCTTPEEREIAKQTAGLYLQLAIATHVSNHGCVPVGTPPVLAQSVYAQLGLAVSA